MSEKLLLSYLKLDLNIKKPDLDICWQEGYEAAQASISETTNPYKYDSLECKFWNDGWWEAIYSEEIAIDAANKLENNAEIEAIKTKIEKIVTTEIIKRSNVKKSEQV